MKHTITALIPHKLILMYRSLKPFWRKLTQKNSRRKKSIPILHLHITDHCNLNCRGCDNFSPLAPEVFADISVFENDCAQISKLSNGRIDEIQLLGGEPLLHPQLTDFMSIARKYFPTTPINLISNGILLAQQKKEFWAACNNYNIDIIVTKYPIKIDFDAIEKRAQQEGVHFNYYGRTAEVEKNMQCMPLDLEGKQNAKDSFLRCSSANRCISLDNGRMYTCSLIPYIKYFNAHFNKNLEVTEADYIDIYKAKSMDEILNFLSKPMPFCKYCKQKEMIWDIGYGVSKKEIREWIGE